MRYDNGDGFEDEAGYEEGGAEPAGYDEADDDHGGVTDAYELGYQDARVAVEDSAEIARTADSLEERYKRPVDGLSTRAMRSGAALSAISTMASKRGLWRSCSTSGWLDVEPDPTALQASSSRLRTSLEVSFGKSGGLLAECFRRRSRTWAWRRQ